MISKTFGQGGDFSDLGTAWNWLVSLGNLTDNYVFTQISDFVEATGIYGDAGIKIVLFNAKTVTFQNPNNYTITTVHSFAFRDANAAASTADILILDKLKIVSTTEQTSLISAAPWFADRSMSVYYKNLCVTSTIKLSNKRAIWLYRWANVHVILNCRIFGFGVGINTAISDGNTSGSDHKIENCSIFDCINGIVLGGSTAAKNVTIKNTVAFGCDTIDFAAGGEHNIITNCGDSDNSISACGGVLTSNITGVTNGDFLSVDSGSTQFLKIKGDSSLYGLGNTTLGLWNTADFEGRIRPSYGGLVSIGAHEPIGANVIMRSRINGKWYQVTKPIAI